MSVERRSYFYPDGLITVNVLALIALGWGIISVIAWG